MNYTLLENGILLPQEVTCSPRSPALDAWDGDGNIMATVMRPNLEIELYSVQNLFPEHCMISGPAGITVSLVRDEDVEAYTVGCLSEGCTVNGREVTRSLRNMIFPSTIP